MRVRAFVRFFKISLCTHRENPAVPYREAFRRWLGIVHRDDVATLKNCIGRPFWRGTLIAA